MYLLCASVSPAHARKQAKNQAENQADLPELERLYVNVPLAYAFLYPAGWTVQQIGGAVRADDVGFEPGHFMLKSAGEGFSA